MRYSILAFVGLSWSAGAVCGQASLPPLPPTTQQNPAVAPASPLPSPLPGATASQPSPFPMEMTVLAQGGVEVRSGPGVEGYYPTTKLRFGDKVLVLYELKEQAGWYAIKPPPDSFSWVSGKYLKAVPGDQRIGYLVADGNTPVPILPGSRLVNKEPNVEIAKVDSGSLVTIVDRPMETGGQKWYPIAPTPREVRYIPKDSVVPPQSASVAPPDWTRAQGATFPGFPQNNWGAPGSLVANSGGQPVGTPASFSQPAGQWQQFNGVAAQPPQWSQWGKLRKTAFNDKDGQPMYVLEDRAGKPIVYVTTAPGTSLRNYIDQTVCLYGMITYRSDGYQRTHYMIASHVATP